MSRDSTAAFPELRRAFSGYLHEDVFAEAGTPKAALQKFWADAAPSERRRFQREVARFLARTAALDVDELRHLIHQLGCRWMPPSREALVGLLSDAAHLPKPSSR